MRLNDLDRLRVRAEVSLSALDSLVVHLGGLSEQRKSVLFVSEGPPLMVDNLSLQDRLNDVIAAAEHRQCHHSHAGCAAAESGAVRKRGERDADVIDRRT